jgi:hypothetical protein
MPNMQLPGAAMASFGNQPAVSKQNQIHGLTGCKGPANGTELVQSSVSATRLHICKLATLRTQWYGLSRMVEPN